MMHLNWYDAVKDNFASFVFCSSFANRVSVSGHPYINFNRNQSIFPAAYLVCQVDALFNLFPSGVLICIAHHILHSMPCLASCCLCIALWLIIVLLLVFLLSVEPGDEFVHKEPVEYAYEDQALVNSENLAGKMIIPLISLLFLLASYFALSLCRATYHLFIMPPILPCQASNTPS